VAAQAHVLLAQRQRLARGHAQLQLDQIEPGHGLGHRVLDLQARVHLHEIEPALGVEQALERAHPLIADRPCRRDRGRAHALAQRRVDGRRRRLLDDLLVAPLHRAVALAEVNRVAVAVGQHLDLDVARVGDDTFEDQAVVPKGVARLGACAAQQLGKVAGVVHEPHAAPATTGRGLDHDGKADALGFGQQALITLVLAVVAGDAGHASRPHEALGPGLVAHRANRLGRGADEDQSGVAAGLGEVGGQDGAWGKMPIFLHRICSITSSAPPPIEGRRMSRNRREIRLSRA
jgi:hypothetical protein